MCFAIFQNMSLLRIFEINLFLCHVLAQTEKCSHYLPKIDVNLSDSSHGNTILF